MKPALIAALLAATTFFLLGSFWLLTGRHLLVQPAEALAASQTFCDMTGEELRFTTVDGFVSAGDPVTLNNGNVSRTVVMQFTANAFVSSGGEIRIAYSVDGAEPFINEFGPANLANCTEYGQTRTTFAVFPDLAPGEHTIKPYVHIGVGDGRVSGILWQRCFYVTR